MGLSYRSRPTVRTQRGSEGFLGHLNDTLQAAESWQQAGQVFLDGWERLFSETRDESLTIRILQLKGVIDGVEPFRSASEKTEQALEIAADYNAIVRRQGVAGGNRGCTEAASEAS